MGLKDLDLNKAKHAAWFPRALIESDNQTKKIILKYDY